MGGCSSNQSGEKTSRSTSRKPTHATRKRAVFEKEDYSTGSDCADVIIDTGHDENAIADSLNNYPHPSPPDQVGGRIKQRDIWYDDDEFNDAIDELDVLKEEIINDVHDLNVSGTRELNNNNSDPLPSLDFFEIDEHARKAGNKESASFDNLFEYLNQIVKDKANKKVLTARAIVVWMSAQSIEKTNFGKPSKESPSGLLQLLKEKNLTYASCYALLCRKARLKCVKITGYVKAADYDPGNDMISESSWNAVHVESGWQLVHPFWICTPIYGDKLGGWVKVESDDESNIGNKKRKPGGIVRNTFQDRYFMPEPEEFIYECCAIDPKWQLVKTPLVVTSREQFLQMPYLRPPFFGLGFRLKSKQTCVMTSRNGFCRIVLKCHSRNSHMMVLRYTLHSKDNKEKSRAKLDEANTPKEANTQIKAYTPTREQSMKEANTQKKAYTPTREHSTKEADTQIKAYTPTSEHTMKESNTQKKSYTPTREQYTKETDTQIKAYTPTNSYTSTREHYTKDANTQKKAEATMNQTYTSKETNSLKEEDISRMVLNVRAGRLFIFDIRFPKPGDYKLVIYGGPMNTPALRLCETAIVCKRQITDRCLLPIDCQNVGWGPGPLSMEAELFMPSKPSGIILVDKVSKKVEIKFSLSRKRQKCSAYMKGFTNGEIQQFDECLDVKTENKQLLIKATIPHEGEFAVLINRVMKGSTNEVNVCNYLLTTLDGNGTRAKERYAKRKLEDSLAEDVQPEYWKKKISTVEKQLDKCKREHVPTSDDFMLSASEELDFLRCKDNLRDCKLRRNPFFIRRTLTIVGNYKNKSLLSKEIETVRGLVKEIESEEGVRQDEEKRDPKITKASQAILKIRYPTKEMFDVIKSLFLLVGEPISETMEWRLIQSRFRKTGIVGNNVPDKIARIRPRDINHDKRRKAQRFIEQHDDATIRNLNAGIYTFYEWVIKTLHEG